MKHVRSMVRCAAILVVLGGSLLGGSVPSELTAVAQSGRKPPEKARKAQPPAEAPATPAEPGQPPQEQIPQGDPSAPEPPPVKQKDLENAVQLGVDVVNVETSVVEKKSGQILRNLKRENFEVYEDGVKQELANFVPTEGPVTMVLIIEFSKRIDNYFIRKREVLEPAYAFVTQFVKPGDNIAIVAFDMRPEVVTDFTGDPKKLAAGIQFLARNYPAFSESNLFDTLKFVIEGGTVNEVEYSGLKGVDQRSAIVLVSIGVDTFSKINYDQIRKIVAAGGAPIYTIGVGNLFYKRYESRLPPEENLTWLQAFNTLRTFSRMTGGEYFPITFSGEIPTTMRSIANLMRSQYSLGYSPSNTRHEGKQRKIVVKVDPDGDGKFGDKGFEVHHRETYIEPLETARK
jgi:Ca-activated chloride channel family protein